jgi:hypothetical protein
MLLRLAYLGITNAFAVLRLLPGVAGQSPYPGSIWRGSITHHV